MKYIDNFVFLWKHGKTQVSQITISVRVNCFNTMHNCTNYPPGGKPRQRCERFEKNDVFAIAKLLIHSPKWSLKSPGFWSGFLTMTCNLQGICAWKLARFFFHSHCHTILQGLTCDLHQTFGRGVHPTPLPHPDASHQLWVDTAVGSRRERERAWDGRLR